MLLLLSLFVFQDVPVTLKVTGSPVRGSDGSIRYNDYVRFESEGMLLTADKAIYYENLNTIEAEGQIKIDLQTDQGILEIQAEKMSFHLGQEAGFFEGVSAQFNSEFFFVGARMEVLGKNKFLIIDGVLSSCNQPIRHWSIRIKQAIIEREGYARIKSASLHMGKVPVFYMPYMVMPAFSQRRSGLLMAEPGDSSRNGRFLQIPYFYAPRQDLDFTIAPQFFEDAGAKWNLESRYTPSAKTGGTLEAAFIKDKIIKESTNRPLESGEPINSDRFRVKWKHTQQTNLGYFRADVNTGSDFQFDRDFELNPAEGRIRDYVSHVGLQNDWFGHSFFIELEDRERIFNDGQTVRQWRRLPSVQIFQPLKVLPWGLTWQSRYHLDFFRLKGFESLSEDQGFRFGMNGALTKPISLGPWFRSNIAAGITGVYQKHDGDQRELGGPFVGFEVFAPRLYKRFGKNRQWAHFLEFSLENKWGKEGEDSLFPELFLDELDSFIEKQGFGPSTEWNMKSRLYKTTRGFSQPWLDVEIRQTIFWDQTQDTPIDIRAKVAQNDVLTGNAFVQLNPDSLELDTLAIYANVRHNRWRGYMGYVNRTLSGATQESVIATSDLAIQRSQFRIAVDYDFKLDSFKSQEFMYSYQGACMGFALRYVSSPFTSTGSDQEWFQVLVRLKNLGELGKRF